MVLNEVTVADRARVFRRLRIGNGRPFDPSGSGSDRIEEGRCSVAVGERPSSRSN